MRIGWTLPVHGCYHHVLATPRATTAICGRRARRWYYSSRSIGSGEQVCSACADAVRAAAATLVEWEARRRVQRELEANAILVAERASRL